MTTKSIKEKKRKVYVEKIACWDKDQMVKSEAEFKEFKPRLKFETRLKRC